jgi:hypothetical protein
MALNNIQILRENGGVGATLPGEDHYSGLLVYLDDAELPTADSGVTGFSTTNRIIPISTIEYAESLGIKPTSNKWIIKALHYHISEALRINPAIMLWVGLYTKPAVPTPGYDFKEIKTMQVFTGGKIRQIGVYTPDNNLVAGDLTKLQGIAVSLQTDDMPLSILYSPNIANISGLTDMRAIGQSNVTILIGQDGEGIAKTLYTEATKTVGTIGNAIGMLSKVSVHESIAWVQKCPSGISQPAFADGTLYNSVDTAVINTLNDNGYVFLRMFTGLNGSFYNDSFTMDTITSDYAYIERVRTMDKAVRGIRTYLLPHLSSPLYVDPKTGKLSEGTIAFLETVANRQLEAMEKAKELSGFKVFIDPDQNVLVSSEMEFVIKQVGVGVMRRMKIKISYTTKID